MFSIVYDRAKKRYTCKPASELTASELLQVYATYRTVKEAKIMLKGLNNKRSGGDVCSCI